MFYSGHGPRHPDLEPTTVSQQPSSAVLQKPTSEMLTDISLLIIALILVLFSISNDFSVI